MIRLYFYVEGQTEQGYVSQVLRPHLASFGVQVMGSVLAASGKRHGIVSRGGGRRYQPMRNDLGRLLRQHHQPDVRFTTMFDLYALYTGFPGEDEAEKLRHDPYRRVHHLERAFYQNIGDRRFIPHLQLHEFETILLCDPEQFRLIYESCDRQVSELQQLIAEVRSPELINDGQATAPSWRIDRLFPGYRDAKTTIGVELAACVGLETVRQKCPHFADWLGTLESLDQPGTATT
jgi:hypothetical protein